MSWKTITGNVYEITTESNSATLFDTDSVLLHAPGISLIYFEENEDGMPTSGSSIMSVPQNRFDEVQEIVNTEDIIYENVSVDVYVVDRYVVYPEIVKDSMVYGGHTYLYESEEQSFVFRIICDQLVDVFGTESIKPKDTRVVIERLNGDMTAITEKSFKQYISEGKLYRLVALDEEARGLYKDTVKDPYWD
jgi:hypothetical protein